MADAPPPVPSKPAARKRDTTASLVAGSSVVGPRCLPVLDSLLEPSARSAGVWRRGLRAIRAHKGGRGVAHAASREKGQ